MIGPRAAVLDTLISCGIALMTASTIAAPTGGMGNRRYACAARRDGNAIGGTPVGTRAANRNWRDAGNSGVVLSLAGMWTTRKPARQRHSRRKTAVGSLRQQVSDGHNGHK